MKARRGEGQGEGQEGEEGKGQRGNVETLKNNDKYDKRKAKVERLNVRAVVVTILAQDITQSRTNPTPIGHQTTLYHINPTLHYTN